MYLEQPAEVKQDTQNAALIEFNRGTRTLTLDVFGPAPDFFFYLLRDSISVVLARWPGRIGNVRRCRQSPNC